MTIIPEESGIDNTIEKRFAAFIKRFGIRGILREVNAAKDKGIPACAVFVFVLGLVFTRMNLYSLINSGARKISFGKDVIYRFLGNPSIHWEAFVRKLSRTVVAEIDKLTDEGRRSALVLDDTPYYRDRSKKVELLSRCYDHSENRYYKGFGLLNLAWTDGVTLMPVDFRLLASGNDDNLLEGSHVKEDGRTLATKRRRDARTDKPTLALEMLKSARNTAVQTKFVLFDSWFSSPKFVTNVKQLGYDVVARLKNNDNYRYLYQDQCLSIGRIFRANKKRRGMSRYLLSVIVHVRVRDSDETIPAKIVFVRDKCNRKKWIALVSTDVSLTEDEVVALYGKRWDIEPFHKILKSNLRLAKEFQARSFDALVAHTALVLTRYIFLSLENRENNDERSVCALFLAVCCELEDISFCYAFTVILSALKHCTEDYLGLAHDRIDELVLLFMATLPSFITDRLDAPLCES
jgi:hypothetical protein